MQFTAVVTALLLAASSAVAAPSTDAALAKRQGSGQVYIRFYSDAGCGNWVEDTVINENVSLDRVCYNYTQTTPPYRSYNVITNSATETVRLYQLPDCPENVGTHQDVKNDTTHGVGCRAGTFSSYKFDPPV